MMIHIKFDDDILMHTHTHLMCERPHQSNALACQMDGERGSDGGQIQEVRRAFKYVE